MKIECVRNILDLQYSPFSFSSLSVRPSNQEGKSVLLPLAELVASPWPPLALPSCPPPNVAGALLGFLSSAAEETLPAGVVFLLRAHVDVAAHPDVAYFSNARFVPVDPSVKDEEEGLLS